MKKVWKWIIGIVIGLVVLAILVGVGMAFRMHYGFAGMRAFDGDGFRSYGMTPFNGMHRGLGMMPFGGMHRGFGGGIFGGLVQLGVLALIVLGIIWLVRKLRNPAASVAPIVPAAPTASCGKCGYSVQTEWKVCPNCGRKL